MLDRLLVHPRLKHLTDQPWSEATATDVLSPPTRGTPIDPAVFGYIRVSQVEGESGPATQCRTLNGHGLRHDRTFTDVASGKNMRRPSWTELREMLKPGDTVVVPRIDRLARNLTEGLKTIEDRYTVTRRRRDRLRSVG